MGSRVREDGSGDSRRDGGSLCRKSCRRGRTCRRGRDILRGRDCRRYGNRLRLGLALRRLLLLLTVLRESYAEGTTFSAQGVASICTKPFSGSDDCVTISVGFT